MLWVLRFLSTLSLRRATGCGQYCIRAQGESFLSTLSLRRATHPIGILVRVIKISIHALLAESDKPATGRNDQDNIFLSTLSLRRATDNLTQGVFNLFTFLSTLSLRRATIRHKREKPRQTNFYPRSPCGERPRRPGQTAKAYRFLSTLSLRRAT